MSDYWRERLSEERLREIEARVEGASHSPWRAKDGGSRAPSYVDVPPPAGAEDEDADDEGPLVAETFTGDTGDPFKNALFIASARQDVPNLVAEIRALRAERDRLTAKVALLGRLAAAVKAFRSARRSRGPEASENEHKTWDQLKDALAIWDRATAAEGEAK